MFHNAFGNKDSFEDYVNIGTFNVLSDQLFTNPVEYLDTHLDTQYFEELIEMYNKKIQFDRNKKNRFPILLLIFLSDILFNPNDMTELYGYSTQKNTMFNSLRFDCKQFLEIVGLENNEKIKN